MSRSFIVLLLFLALVLGLRGLVAAVSDWAAQAPTPVLRWVFVPERVPLGAPFAAWYGVGVKQGEGVSRAWLQLRMCNQSGECIHGARRQLPAGESKGLLSATRNLPVGTYIVEVLILREDRFGVPRTVGVYFAEVTNG